MPSKLSPHSHIQLASHSADVLQLFHNSSKCLPVSMSWKMLQQEEMHTASISRGGGGGCVAGRGMYLGHVAFII